MTSELITLYGVSSGTETSGTFVLSAEIINAASGAPNYLRIPFGTSVKIWESKVGGNPHTTYVDVSMNYGSSYATTVNADVLTTSGTMVTITREGRPIVIDNFGGGTLMRFRYNAVAAPVANGELKCQYNLEVVE